LSGEVYDYLSTWYMFVGIPVLATFTYFIWKAKQEYGRKHGIEINHEETQIDEFTEV